MTDPYIAGLRRELHDHERAGRAERAAQVRAELARLGVDLDAGQRTAQAAPAPERTSARTRTRRR